jgi:uncharacterized protein YegL
LKLLFLSAITFDSIAQQIIPLTDLASFQMVDIKATATALGEALKLVTHKIDTVQKQQLNKRDWKPFFMTDG